MLVRRLTPQEDKLDLAHIPKEQLEGVARLLGALIGRAHVRGVVGRKPRTWTVSDRQYVIDCAVRMAGFHEAAYLAFCRLASGG
jgi:hypothetical protein